MLEYRAGIRIVSFGYRIGIDQIYVVKSVHLIYMDGRGGALDRGMNS